MTLSAPPRIHCVSLYWTDPAGLYAHLEECLRDMGLTGRVRPEELVNPVMDYIGLGLSQSTDAELGEATARYRNGNP